MAPGPKTSGVDLVRIIVWAGAGVVLSYIGISTAQSMSDLSEEVYKLRRSLDKLEVVVSSLPPRDLILRVEILEQKQEWDDNHHRQGHGKGEGLTR